MARKTGGGWQRGVKRGRSTSRRAEEECRTSRGREERLYVQQEAGGRGETSAGRSGRGEKTTEDRMRYTGLK